MPHAICTLCRALLQCEYVLWMSSPIVAQEIMKFATFGAASGETFPKMIFSFQHDVIPGTLWFRYNTYHVQKSDSCFPLVTTLPCCVGPCYKEVEPIIAILSRCNTFMTSAYQSSYSLVSSLLTREKQARQRSRAGDPGVGTSITHSSTLHTLLWWEYFCHRLMLSQCGALMFY